MTVTASTQPPADETTATSSDLITRAASVVPLLCQNAKATEENRRVVEENIEAIKEAGLSGWPCPGGSEATRRTSRPSSRSAPRWPAATGPPPGSAR